MARLYSRSAPAKSYSCALTCPSVACGYWSRLDRPRIGRVRRVEARWDRVRPSMFGAPAMGFNTDYTGYVSAFRAQFGAQPPGVVAMAGSGGVGKAVAFGLAELGAKTIALFDIDDGKSRSLAAALQRHQGAMSVRVAASLADACDGADGLVNCTPLGMVAPAGAPVRPAVRMRTPSTTQRWTMGHSPPSLVRTTYLWPVLPGDQEHRRGPGRREVERRHHLGGERRQQRPVEPEQLDQHRRDGEVEHVVERRRESLAEERRSHQLHGVRREGDDARRPNVRSWRLCPGRRGGARRLDR